MRIVCRGARRVVGRGGKWEQRNQYYGTLVKVGGGWAQGSGKVMSSSEILERL